MPCDLETQSKYARKVSEKKTTKESAITCFCSNTLEKKIFPKQLEAALKKQSSSKPHTICLTDP